ncbi:MAG: hypothetical protein ACKVOK_14305 [Flavobacteriales bacterium]
MNTKTVIFLTTSALVACFVLLIGCESSEKKQDAAKENVIDAQKDLKSAEEELIETQQSSSVNPNYTLTPAQKEVRSAEWKIYKANADAKIADNDAQILELKVKMKKPGQTWDDVYAKRIEKLEAQNNALRVKINTYDPEKSDWETFKREFNHDMDSFGQAFKDLTTNNAK